MKRLICAALMGGLATGAWLAPALRADDEAAAPKEHGTMDMGKLKEKLGLSDDQAAKLKDAHKAHAEAVKPLREEMKKGIEKLRDQVKNKASDADVQATLDQLKQTRKALRDAQEKHIGDMEAILNPTQRAKMLLGMLKRMRERGGKGKDSKEGSEAPKGPAGDDGEESAD